MPVALPGNLTSHSPPTRVMSPAGTPAPATRPECGWLVSHQDRAVQRSWSNPATGRAPAEGERVGGLDICLQERQVLG